MSQENLEIVKRAQRRAIDMVKLFQVRTLPKPPGLRTSGVARENAELVYQAHDAFNRRDLDAFVALTDPEVELIPLYVELPGITTYRGHDGVRSWWQDLFAVFPAFSTEIDEVRDLGEVTVARVRFLGHGMGSDAPMEQTRWQVAEWRHQRAVRWRTCPSEAEALEAAGVWE